MAQQPIEGQDPTPTYLNIEVKDCLASVGMTCDKFPSSFLLCKPELSLKFCSCTDSLLYCLKTPLHRDRTASRSMSPKTVTFKVFIQLNNVWQKSNETSNTASDLATLRYFCIPTSEECNLKIKVIPILILMWTS